VARQLKDFIITSHAAAQMKRRGISEGVVRLILSAPERRDTVRSGRDLFQARAAFAGKTYLVRVFVDVDRQPAEVVTVYRSSRIEKYRRGQP